MTSGLCVVIANIVWIICVVLFFNPAQYKRGFVDGVQSRINYEQGK